MIKITKKNIQALIRNMLLISGIVGIAVSYSSVYLFHIILTLSLTYIFYQLINDRHYLKTLLMGYPIPTLLFLATTFLTYTVLLFFAENTTYALFHLAFITIGGLIIFIIPTFTYDIKDFKKSIIVLGIIVGVDLLLGFAESLGAFRWYISGLSDVVQYFGYQNEIQTILSKAISFDYVHTMPTGFQYNPNDFAVLASLALPFFLLLRNKYLSLIGSLLIIWLTVAAGAKIVFIANIFMIIISFFYTFSKKHIFKLIIPLLFVVFIITNGFGFIQGRNIKINEIQAFCYKMVGIAPPKYNLQLKETDNSASLRKELLLFGFHKSIEHKLLGYGGGQSRYQMEKAGGITKDKICNLHCFWLELLFEGGIIYLLVFIVFYIYILLNLLKIARSNKDNFIGSSSSSLIISLCGFVISSNAPSSVIYFLPMYILLGISISLIKICKNESSFVI